MDTKTRKKNQLPITLQPPLDSFENSKLKKTAKKLYQTLATEFTRKISYWRTFKHIRGLIEIGTN